MRPITGNTRGQALPLVALALWIIAFVAVAVALVGQRAIDRARAQAGADAVALGSAGGGDADVLARRNGVVVESIDRGPPVDVEVSSGRASAAARSVPGRPEWNGLDRRVREALRRAESVLGFRVPIVSGRRSRADQERLWAARSTNPYPVAPPGTSLHERGLAVDVPIAVAEALARVTSVTGLCRPLPAADPVHFELC